MRAQGAVPHRVSHTGENQTFGQAVQAGVEAAYRLERCYAAMKVNLSQLVAAWRDTVTQSVRPAAMPVSRFREVLHRCPATLLVPPHQSTFTAHIGKSIYAPQLLHWLIEVPPANVRILTLEHYIKSPLEEVSSLLGWLGLSMHVKNPTGGMRAPPEMDFLAQAARAVAEPQNVHADSMKRSATATADVESHRDRAQALFDRYAPPLHEILAMLKAHSARVPQAEKRSNEHLAKATSAKAHVPWPKVAANQKHVGLPEGATRSREAVTSPMGISDASAALPSHSGGGRCLHSQPRGSKLLLMIDGHEQVWLSVRTRLGSGLGLG